MILSVVTSRRRFDPEEFSASQVTTFLQNLRKYRLSPSPQLCSKALPQEMVESVDIANERPRPNGWAEKMGVPSGAGRCGAFVERLRCTGGVGACMPASGWSETPSSVAAGLSRSVRFVP